MFPSKREDVRRLKMGKRGFITESDMSHVCKRYGVSIVLTLLREVARSDTAVLDWRALVSETATGIKNPREYQALWRHLAYRTELANPLDDETQPLDDESDLEYEVEPFPHVLPDIAAEVAIRVKADLQRVGMGSIVNGKRKAAEASTKSKSSQHATQGTTTGKNHIDKKQRQSGPQTLQATGVKREKASSVVGPDPMVQAAAVAAGARIAPASTAASLLKVASSSYQGISDARSGSLSSVHYFRSGSGTPATLPQFKFQFGSGKQDPSKHTSAKGGGLIPSKSRSKGSCSSGKAVAVRGPVVPHSTGPGSSGGSVCSSAASRVGGLSRHSESPAFNQVGMAPTVGSSSPHSGMGPTILSDIAPVLSSVGSFPQSMVVATSASTLSPNAPVLSSVASSPQPLGLAPPAASTLPVLSTLVPSPMATIAASTLSPIVPVPSSVASSSQPRVAPSAASTLPAIVPVLAPADAESSAHSKVAPTAVSRPSATSPPTQVSVESSPYSGLAQTAASGSSAIAQTLAHNSASTQQAPLVSSVGSSPLAGVASTGSSAIISQQKPVVSPLAGQPPISATTYSKRNKTL